MQTVGRLSEAEPSSIYTSRHRSHAPLQYDFYNATIHDVDFADDGVTATDHGPKTMTGVHQAQFLAEFTIEQAANARKAGKPFFIHTTPVMPHWGTCIGPHPPAPGYP